MTRWLLLALLLTPAAASGAVYKSTDGLFNYQGSTLSQVGVLSFVDGSSQTTAFNAASALTRSSSVVIAQTVFTNTTFGVCAATAVLTTRGFPVSVTVVAVMENTTANIDMNATVLVNGAYPSELATGKSVMGTVAAQGGDDTNGNFQVMLSNVAAGTNSFCVAFKTAANTGTVLSGTSYLAQLTAMESPQ